MFGDGIVIEQLNMFDLLFPPKEEKPFRYGRTTKERFDQLKYKRIYHFGDMNHNNYVYTYEYDKERYLAIQINNYIIALEVGFEEKETFTRQFRFPACTMYYFYTNGEEADFKHRELVLNEICGYNHARVCKYAKGDEAKFYNSELTLDEIIQNIKNYFVKNKEIEFK